MWQQPIALKYGKKVAIENSKRVTLRNNSLAVQGVCPNCCTKGVSNGESLSSPEIKDAPLNKSSFCSMARLAAK